MTRAAERPLLQVIIGSTRPGRVGLPVATWFVDAARSVDLFDVEVVDLAEVGLPLLDEPHHPRLRQYVHDHTKAWSSTIDRGDAYVFVIPEYNYGFNAATKNAIDYLHAEWKYKPFACVSYGGIAAGTRAVQMLKQVLTTLDMVAVFDAVNVAFVQQQIRDGIFVPTPGNIAAAEALLTALNRWVRATRDLRAAEAVRAAG